MNTLFNIIMLLTFNHHFLVEHNGHVFDQGQVYEQAFDAAAKQYDSNHATDSSKVFDNGFIGIEDAQYWYEGCYHKVRWGVPSLAYSIDPQTFSATVYSSLAVIVNPQYVTDTDTLSPVLSEAFTRLLAQQHDPNLGNGINIFTACVGDPNPVLTTQTIHNDRTKKGEIQ